MSDVTPQPIHIQLSREEVLAILELLQARFIPGLEAEPTGELNADQQAVALVVARRALMARELAQVGSDGEFRLHRLLLTAVGTCAYAQSTAFVYHWASGSPEPTRLFAHLRGNDAVAHTSANPLLHRFSLFGGKEQLLAHLLDFCGYQAASDAPADGEFSVPAAVFANARELVNAGQLAEAKAALAGAGVPDATAGAFLAVLSANPHVAILQTLKPQSAEAVRSRELTLIHLDGRAWWVLPTAADANAGTLLVRQASPDEIRSALAQWL